MRASRARGARTRRRRGRGADTDSGLKRRAATACEPARNRLPSAGEGVPWERGHPARSVNPAGGTPANPGSNPPRVRGHPARSVSPAGGTPANPGLIHRTSTDSACGVAASHHVVGIDVHERTRVSIPRGPRVVRPTNEPSRCRLTCERLGKVTPTFVEVPRIASPESFCLSWESMRTVRRDSPRRNAKPCLGHQRKRGRGETVYRLRTDLRPAFTSASPKSSGSTTPLSR